MGQENASISPPGSSDEMPGGSRQFVNEVQELAADQGVAPGALFSFIASLHSGSHEACDAALGGGDSTTAATSASRAVTTQRHAAQSTPRAWPKAV
jgi:hypothetical protein